MAILRPIQADITVVPTDAIVTPANQQLAGAGGIDGAIHRAGGPTVLDECRAIMAANGPCRPGHAVLTQAGELPCRYVIHTVTPGWAGSKDRDAEATLASCYRLALALAERVGARSVAFPNLGATVHGLPSVRAAEIARRTVQHHLAGPHGLAEVLFVCADDDELELYEEALTQAASH